MPLFHNEDAREKKYIERGGVTLFVTGCHIRCKSLLRGVVDRC